jgi:hypothetical protein
MITPTKRKDRNMKLYNSRYLAKKENPEMVIVRVDGGYIVMNATQYSVWRKQK